MKIGTYESLCDMQPLYVALAELDSSLLDAEAKRFLLHKLKQDLKALKGHLHHIEAMVKSHPLSRGR